MYSKLLEPINQISDLEENETELIKSSFKPFQLAKGEFFLEAGKINIHIGFLHKGLVRYFVYKDK